MNYEDSIKQVAKDLCLPVKVVDKTYKAFWRFIRDTINELPLKTDLTEEEFNKLRTNFNIPSLGKLNCTYNKIQYIKDKYKSFIKLRERENVKNKES